MRKPVPKFRIVEIGKLDGGYAIKVEVIEDEAKERCLNIYRKEKTPIWY